MTILILSGTGEARQIADFCAAKRIDAIASLAGETRAPIPHAIPTRIGGFGGSDGFVTYLHDQEIRAVLDMTHPFAAQISARSAKDCAQLSIPYLRFARPPWSPEAGDHWVMIAGEDAAKAHISPGQNLFLATGRKSLLRFGSLQDCTLYCRQIDPPQDAFPFPNGKFVIGRPPFSVAEEIALFLKLKIDWLVVKNAGGKASFSKLEAARELGLPVLMLQRPVVPQGTQTASLDVVKDWLDTHAVD